MWLRLLPLIGLYTRTRDNGTANSVTPVHAKKWSSKHFLTLIFKKGISQLKPKIVRHLWKYPRTLIAAYRTVERLA
jgi:hypothetical protein